MTYLECIWKDKVVLIVSLLSKNGKVHSRIKPWIGRTGIVVKESKNNQLLVRIRLNKRIAYISIPPGCVIDLETANVL